MFTANEKEDSRLQPLRGKGSIVIHRLLQSHAFTIPPSWPSSCFNSKQWQVHRAKVLSFITQRVVSHLLFTSEV
ncbi:hypothetical protein ABKN59_006739 [Abortiporus biennis]